MCGIVGVLDPRRRLAHERLSFQIEHMMQLLDHRGPDSSGLWVDDVRRVALGHRRLSIVDLSEFGSQPMSSCDGRWVIVYNGEIYNSDDLKRQLRQTRFRGQSDTEVLVEAIAEFGVFDTLRRIDGMYSFAGWDEKEGQLWLVSDRFGEKPLYYAWIDHILIFGSEIKSLSSFDSTSFSIDRVALGELLTYGFIPAPRTIYEGVKKICPGSVVTVSCPGDEVIVHEEKYWDPVVAARETETQVRTDVELLEELEHLLTDSIRSRMISDVPLGAFLSGGVDSTMVVALMQQISSDRVRTFSVGFADAKYDESMYARQVADHLGTEHSELFLGAGDISAIVRDLPKIFCEPFADSSQIPTYAVSRLASESVSVALSGDGADELFGGYDRYRAFSGLDRIAGGTPKSVMRLASAVVGAVPVGVWNRIETGSLTKLMPPTLRTRTAEKIGRASRVLRESKGDSRYLHFLATGNVPDDLIIGYRDVVTPKLGYETFGTAIEKAMLMDTMFYLPNDILVKVDRASMANSLEVRVPFLNPDVFSFAWSLAPNIRDRDGMTKWPLRQLLARHVPREVVGRPKMGFGVPLGEWLRTELFSWASELLDEQLLNNQGYLDPGQVGSMWRRHTSMREDLSRQLWPILMFQAWIREWK